MIVRRIVGMGFIALAFVLTGACNVTPTQEATSSSSTQDAPILSTALVRDCEFKVPPGEELKVGDLAVDFTLKDVNGNNHTLSEMLQEKPVVLIFGSYT
jgi:hypothetical protein